MLFFEQRISATILIVIVTGFYSCRYLVLLFASYFYSFQILPNTKIVGKTNTIYFIIQKVYIYIYYKEGLNIYIYICKYTVNLCYEGISVLSLNIFEGNLLHLWYLPTATLNPKQSILHLRLGMHIYKRIYLFYNRIWKAHKISSKFMPVYGACKYINSNVK